MPLGAIMIDVQVTASMHAIEAKVNLFRKEMESVNTHINFFKTQIDQLYQKPDVPAEFREFKCKMDTFIQESSQRNDSSKTLVDGIRRTLETIKHAVSHHENEIRMLRDSMPIMAKQIAESKDELSQKIVSISTAFTNRFDIHTEHQKKQLETFSAQAMKAPNSVIDSNSKLVQKMEISCIDAANALLKASNIELSVKLLERKLENLTLQVKKAELSQQA